MTATRWILPAALLLAPCQPGIPAQYKPDKPTPVMIVQDGGVFDNLIAKGQMPPAIGIFINPGVLPALTATEQAHLRRLWRPLRALPDRRDPPQSGQAMQSLESEVKSGTADRLLSSVEQPRFGAAVPPAPSTTP